MPTCALFPASLASIEELQRQEAHRKSFWTFLMWLVLCSFLFGGSSAYLLYFYECVLRPSGQQADILAKWSMTLIIGYAYARMLMHVGTQRLLSRHSKTFNLLYDEHQDDCAFMLMDVASALFWNPLVMYGCYYVFVMDDIDVFFRDFGPFAKVILTMFQVDRVLQLTVHYRSERLLHHILTATWTLLVMEWVAALRDPGVFVTGAIMEGLAKLLWYFHFIARMNRAFIRNQPNGEWSNESVVGADVFFIAKTARQQTRIMQIGHSYLWFAHVVAPLAMAGIYLFVKSDSVSLGWKISLPSIIVVFNLVDIPSFKSWRRQSEYSYWTEFELPKKANDETETPSSSTKGEIASV